jgi:hypothetical protein
LSFTANPSIQEYNDALDAIPKAICTTLCSYICENLTGSENKIWHAHPVWFIKQNPIVGYSVQKRGVRLIFWSGADFEEEGLNVVGKKFKDASIFYNDVSEINTRDLVRWITKSKSIQWDYKNIVKRKGLLIRIT